MPLGILKRTLSSDWLPEQVKCVHHARLGLHGLSLRKKENCSERTYRGVRKLWTVSATESQKAVENGQNKENSWVYWASKTVGSLSHLLKYTSIS